MWATHIYTYIYILYILYILYTIYIILYIYIMYTTICILCVYIYCFLMLGVVLDVVFDVAPYQAHA